MVEDFSAKIKMDIKLLIIAFGLLMVFITYWSYRRRELNSPETAFWQLIWFGIIAGALFPKLFDPFIRPFRVLRLMDLATILGFMIITPLGFFLFRRTKVLEKKIRELVRKLALEKDEE